jgi:hypothetical protein
VARRFTLVAEFLLLWLGGFGTYLASRQAPTAPPAKTALHWAGAVWHHAGRQAALFEKSAQKLLYAGP